MHKPKIIKRFSFSAFPLSQGPKDIVSFLLQMLLQMRQAYFARAMDAEQPLTAFFSSGGKPRQQWLSYQTPLAWPRVTFTSSGISWQQSRNFGNGLAECGKALSSAEIKGENHTGRENAYPLDGLFFFFSF